MGFDRKFVGLAKLSSMLLSLFVGYQVNRLSASLQKLDSSLLVTWRSIAALGRVAFEGVLALPAFSGINKKGLTFGHGAFYRFGEGLPWLLCSYHPSPAKHPNGEADSRNVRQSLADSQKDTRWELVISPGLLRIQRFRKIVTEGCGSEPLLC